MTCWRRLARVFFLTSAACAVAGAGCSDDTSSFFEPIGDSGPVGSGGSLPDPRGDASVRDARSDNDGDVALGEPPNRCVSDRTCTPFGLLCDPASARCVRCVLDQDCDDQVCRNGECVSQVACENSLDCAGEAHGRTVCDRALAICVECVRNADCSKGGDCIDSECVVGSAPDAGELTDSSADGGVVSGGGGAPGSGGRSGTGGADGGSGGATSSGGTTSSGGATGAGGHPVDAGTCTAATFGGHRYLFCPELRSWDAAAIECQQHGMLLARIDSEAEEQFIVEQHETVTGGYDLWFGARDWDNDQTWRWIGGDPFWTGLAGGAPVAGRYANWDSGRPLAPDSVGRCVLAHWDNSRVYQGWWDYHCSSANPRPFVCEEYAVTAGCYDTVMNGSETDVDCGGNCTKCRLNQRCSTADDCETPYCSASGFCVQCTEASHCPADGCGTRAPCCRTGGTCGCDLFGACAF